MKFIPTLIFMDIYAAIFEYTINYSKLKTIYHTEWVKSIKVLVGKLRQNINQSLNPGKVNFVTVNYPWQERGKIRFAVSIVNEVKVV